MAWRTVDVERLIGEDHPARAIWELVGKMDLSSFHQTIGAVEGVAGRPALDPHLLISVWIYAYSEGVSSAREITRRCEYDPAYQWLTGLEVINYHSLSDFRVGHQAALDELFSGALALLSAEGLVTLERVMHDGTKVKACAGADTFRREETLRTHLEMARQQVQEMGDPGNEELSQRVAQARARAARERQQRLEWAQQELEKLRQSKKGEQAQEARVSETDPQARIMKQGDGGFAPSYNVQVSTDAAQGIIVGVGVSQSGSDQGQLVPALQKVEENFQRRPEQAVVDAGFISRETIVEVDQQQVDLIGSMADTRAQAAGQFARRGVEAAFRPEAFTYQPEGNTYQCPAGKVLSYEKKVTGVGVIQHHYRASGADCAACPFREKCCPHSARKGRMVVRAEGSGGGGLPGEDANGSGEANLSATRAGGRVPLGLD
ncbi:MAG TPA: IS1182 family transposase [Terriglobia bacterium]|nr:IS1182 family transposase [Terriglobia bacterium]